MANYSEIINKTLQDLGRIKVELEDIQESILANAEAFRRNFNTNTVNVKQINDLLKENAKLIDQNTKLKEAQTNLLKKQEIAEEKLISAKLNNAKKEADLLVKAEALQNKKLTNAQKELEIKNKQATLDDKAARRLQRDKKAEADAARAKEDFIKKQEIAEEKLTSVKLNNAKKEADILNKNEALQGKKLLNAQRELNLKNKQNATAERSARKAQKEKKLLEDAARAYNRLDGELRKVSKDYQDLAAKRALGESLTAKELGQLNKLQARLKVLGKAYKSVNNDLIRASGGVNRATSSFDSLGFAVAQITRESPAFLNSLNTGFMAISNNIPMLVDEVTKLKEENKALMAQGQPQIKVWKRVASAFFSWQSLISAAIVALTVLGPKIFDYISDLWDSEKALSAAEKAQRALTKAQIEGAKSTADEVLETKLLFEVAKDVTKSMEDRNLAATKLIESSNGLIKATERQNIISGDSLAIEQKLIDAMVRKATLQALLNEASDEFETIATKMNEIRKLDIEIEERANKVRKFGLVSNKEFYELLEKGNQEAVAKLTIDTKLSDLETKRAKLVREKNKAEEEANAILALAKDLTDRYTLGLTDSTKAKQKDRDVTLELLKVGANLNASLVEDEDKSFKERMNLTEALFQRRVLIAQRVLENEMKAAKESKTQRADLEKQALANYYDAIRAAGEEQAKLRKTIQSDALKSVQNNLKAIADAQKKSLDKAIADADGNDKKIEEAKKEHQKALLELQSRYISEVLRDNTDLTDEQLKLLSDMLVAMDGKLDKFRAKSKNNLEFFQDLFKDTFRTVTDSFSKAFNFDVSKFDFVFEELAKNFDKLETTSSKLFSVERIGEWADAAKELIGGVLSANLQRFDNQINAARRARDIILNEETATEEQKEAARRTFEEKERRIKTERAKQERENLLVQIGIDTAVGVAKATAAYLSNPLTAPALSLILPIIIGTGAAQAAFVASQPIPKFEMGTMDAPEGWAYTQEKVPEPIFSKTGVLKSWGVPGGAALTYLEEGDKVFKSRGAAMAAMNAGLVDSSVLLMNSYSNGKALTSVDVDSSLEAYVRRLEKSTERSMKEMKAISKRPINVHNTVEIKQNRPY